MSDLNHRMNNLDNSLYFVFSLVHCEMIHSFVGTAAAVGANRWAWPGEVSSRRADPGGSVAIGRALRFGSSRAASRPVKKRWDSGRVGEKRLSARIWLVRRVFDCCGSRLGRLSV